MHNQTAVSLLVVKRVVRAFAVLFVAGAFIGIFRSYDFYVALSLLLAGSYLIWKTFQGQESRSSGYILLFGAIASAFLGVQLEILGVDNGYWAYHDLPGNRELAYWLAFAWGIAFVFLYRVEASLITLWGLHSLKSKILLTLVLSAVLPTWGEIVAIQFGVWTYYLDWQFFGVPLHAILVLMTFHTGIFLCCIGISHVFGIEDPVFGVRPKSA